MRIAALYDIHGNLPALEAVAAELRREAVDLVIVGGDVLPGPMPCETLDFLEALPLPAVYLRGNGDREVLATRRGEGSAGVPAAYRPTMEWVAARLGPAQAEWVGRWPPTVELTLPGVGRVLFCHATPRSDTELFTSDSSEERLRAIFGETTAAIVVCGHTHIQERCELPGLSILNAGSVGMAAGRGGAEWLVLDSDVSFRKTAYDRESAAARIRATSYPTAEGFAATSVLDPPDVDAVRAAYTRAAEPSRVDDGGHERARFHGRRLH